MSEYHLHIPGLADAIAATPAQAGHTALLHTLRKLPELAQLRLAAPATPADAPPPTVLDDGEPAGAELPRLYLVTDSGGDPAEFVQICIGLGATAARHYELVHAIDVGRLVALAQSLDRASHAASGGRPAPPHPARTGLRPRTGCNAARIFSDWYNSSAGRSGARLCDHWIVRFADWTDPRTSERRIRLMPGWTSHQRLHQVRTERGNIHALYRQLQQLDQRMGVPFSWFFHMLVGSRVQFDAGYHVLSAAERGLVAMPEHDRRVLRDWWARPYGY